MDVEINQPFGKFAAQYLVARKEAFGGKMGPQVLAEECQVAYDRWTAYKKARKARSKPVSSPLGDLEATYALYPRKVGKEAALKAIAKALQRAPLEMIQNAVRAYAEVTARYKEEDRQFIPHPSTWFNEQRWLDDQREWERPGMRPPGSDTPRPTLPPIPEPKDWRAFVMGRWSKNSTHYEIAADHKSSWRSYPRGLQEGIASVYAKETAQPISA